MRRLIFLVIWVLQTPAAFAGCSVLRETVEIPQVNPKDQPAIWAKYLGSELGNSAQSAVFLGCDPNQPFPETAACIWRFGLGDPVARKAFRRIDAALTDCLSPELKRQRDAPVNHPDSYDAFLYRLAGYQITLSLKNKSERAATFVSFRVYGAD